MDLRSAPIEEWRFNIARLGAIVRHYIPNLYGRTSSPLHGGLPTDRLVAEWCVRSRRVENAVSDLPSLATGVKAERIAIPGNVRELCQTRPDEAKEIQSRVRTRFEHLLDAGYAATGFEFNKLNNSDNKNEGVYLLEPYED